MQPVPDLRIPIEVWQLKLDALSLEIFVEMYNGRVGLPTGTAGVASYFPDHTKRDVQGALRVLHREKLIGVRKVRINGKRLNEYQLTPIYKASAEAFRETDGGNPLYSVPLGKLHSLLARNETYHALKPAKTKNSAAPSAAHVRGIYPPFRGVYSEGPSTPHKNLSDYSESCDEIRSLVKAQTPPTTPPYSPPSSPSPEPQYIPPRMRKRKRKLPVRVLRQYEVREARPDVDEEEFEKASSFAHAYWDKLAHYRGQSRHRAMSRAPLDPRKQNYRQFLKGAELADKLGVDYETFVEIQFFWFDRWWAKAPKPYQLYAGKDSVLSAEERVKAYLKQQEEEGEFAKVVDVPPPEPLPSFKAIVEWNKHLLRDMMKWRGFTKEECFVYYTEEFSKEFLRADPDYQRWVKEGKIGG